jgi:hypothetical protein
MSVTLTTAEVADLARWLSEQTWSEFAQSLAGYYAKHGTLSDKQIASAQSMRAKVEARRKPARSTAPTVGQGIYVVTTDDGEVVYRVEPSKTSGNLYARRLVEGVSSADWGWSYERGGIFTVSEAVANGTGRQLSEDEASAYGKATGRCVCCGALLTNDLSISLGIGPVCRKRWF